MSLPTHVEIRDVGPRDGLQPEAPVSVGERIRLVEALVRAGLRRVEVAAFVSPKAVPAMAGGAEVVAGLDRVPGVTYAALVPNLRGAQAALAAGVDEITVTISASEAYNQRNVRMGVDESAEVIATICAAAARPDRSGPPVPVDAVVSCAFGSPYEGDLAPSVVAGLAADLVSRGVDVVTFADTTGVATPRRVDDLLAAVGDRLGRVPIGLHLHDTRGTALVNAYAALQAGVARFDTSVGGLGGSPFAHGAGGNLATESLVALLDDLGIETGIDLDRLLGVTELLTSLVNRPLPSPIAVHGPRSRLAFPSA